MYWCFICNVLRRPRRCTISWTALVKKNDKILLYNHTMFLPLNELEATSFYIVRPNSEVRTLKENNDFNAFMIVFFYICVYLFILSYVLVFQMEKDNSKGKYGFVTVNSYGKLSLFCSWMDFKAICLNRLVFFFQKSLTLRVFSIDRFIWTRQSKWSVSRFKINKQKYSYS